MPYTPRPVTVHACAHCGQPYESRHLRRKYCSNSCNVLASYARTGRQREPRLSRSDLEHVVSTVMALVGEVPEQVRPPITAARPARQESASALIEAREKTEHLARTKKATRLQEARTEVLKLAQAKAQDKK
jgi:hypothetical protein